MNIVILTILLPYPLTSGGAQAQYNMIDRLRFKHKLTLIYPENQMNSAQARRHLQKLWPEVTFRPYRYVRQLCHIPFVFSKALRAYQLLFMPHNERFLVSRILKPYGYPLHASFIHFVEQVLHEQQADLFQVEFYPYLAVPQLLRRPIRSVFVHHEIRYVRNKRQLAPLRLTPKEKALYEKLKRQEIAHLNTYDHVITLTDTDKAELLRAGVKVPISVSPAAVNAVPLPYTEWNGRITFLGGYAHGPNAEGMEWFLKQVVPFIDWSCFPQARIEIIGHGWPASFESMTSRVPVSRKGFVEDLSSAISGSLMIVPILSGSGMRMKLLEAAAMSLPILSTTVGAEGLSFKSEENCLMADTPQAFAEALSRLMGDAGLRRALAESANRLYKECYSPDALAAKRATIYTTSEA